jgi:hypothetical protein
LLRSISKEPRADAGSAQSTFVGFLPRGGRGDDAAAAAGGWRDGKGEYPEEAPPPASPAAAAAGGEGRAPWPSGLRFGGDDGAGCRPSMNARSE